MISSIQQYLENVQYQWAQPRTYLVFVPIISSITYDLQVEKIFSVARQNGDDTKAYEKFANMRKWHIVGFASQLIVSMIALTVLIPANTLLLYPVACGLYGSIATCDLFKTINGSLGISNYRKLEADSAVLMTLLGNRQ